MFRKFYSNLHILENWRIIVSSAYIYIHTMISSIYLDTQPVFKTDVKSEAK